ncbi:disulfide bond formation protein B [Gluconacetobacter sacchari DSM 12717]|uniref:Disulfide bond formation protein B n=1 Tax=Gluconacetobacter sacchari DSM 12717 TaxID=1307940 RepID=A0ABQ0P3Y9_9PROT|nr:disulfide bond formation protein B [Gluconacetobacter sacchari]GBQ21346.1 disulfide bond formation protein B [Gluconacetobacter sacchari DSM 12717]
MMRRGYGMGRGGMGRGPGVVLALAGLAALGVAAWAEHGLGEVPCGLCLWERWPWRVLVVLGLFAALARGQGARAMLWLAVPVMLAACGLSAVHVGVEQGWWPSPLPECRAPVFHPGSFAERLAAMPLRPAKPCDAPNYLIGGLPLSMTAMDGVYAACVLLVIAFCLFRGRRSGRR